MKSFINSLKGGYLFFDQWDMKHGELMAKQLISELMVIFISQL